MNFGIVGFGLHAVKRLIGGFAKSSNCRVVALSRRNPEKARQSATQYNIPRAFTSTEELCQCKDVDAVFVASPNSIHLADVLTAVRHGKHVLCEKPMAMNAAECQQMVEAAHRANVHLGVAQVFRFEESTDWFRRRIGSGEIGTPVFARSEFSFFAGTHHPRSWIRDKMVAGGGPVADIGVHCIDALRFVLGDEVVRVTARGTPANNGTVEDAATLLLEFSRGTLGTVAVSFRAEYRTPMEIVGAAGVLRADDALTVDKPILLEFHRGGVTIETQTVENNLAYAKQVDAFANAVDGKAEFPAPGKEGWKNQLVLDASYRSMRDGKVEDVPALKQLA